MKDKTKHTKIQADQVKHCKASCISLLTTWTIAQTKRKAVMFTKTIFGNKSSLVFIIFVNFDVPVSCLYI